MGTNSIQIERLESESNDGSSCLSSVSPTPPVHADPETQLGLPVLSLDIPQAHATDQLPGRDQAECEVRYVIRDSLAVLLLDPGQRVVQTIRVRNTESGVGDLSRAGQPLQLGGILRAKARESAERCAEWVPRSPPSVGMLLRAFD